MTTLGIPGLWPTLFLLRLIHGPSDACRWDASTEQLCVTKTWIKSLKNATLGSEGYVIRVVKSDVKRVRYLCVRLIP